MIPIERREIKGITIKTAYLIIAGTILICTTIMGTFYSLKTDVKDNNNKIEEVHTQLEANNKYYQLQFDNLANEVKKQGLEIDDLKKRINTK